MIDECEGCHKQKEIVNISQSNMKFCRDCMKGIPEKYWYGNNRKMKFKLDLGVNLPSNPDCDLLVTLGILRDVIKKLDVDKNILILITRVK